VSPARLAGRLARLLFAIALTGYLIFWKTDPSAILGAIAGAHWTWLGAAILLAIVDRLLMAWRWIALLENGGAGRPPVRRLIRIFLVSTFLGTFLPSSVGSDVVRAWSLSRERFGGAQAAASVAMDRLLGIIALVAVAAVGLFLGRHLLPERFLIFALGAAAAGSVMGLLVVYSSRAESFLLGLARALPPVIGNPSAKLVAAVRAYAIHHRVVTAVFVMSLAVNVLRVVQAWVLGLAIGLDQPGVVYFAFVPMINLMMQLPVSIFGLGVAQLGFDWFFAHAGVATADALALSFLFIGLGLLGNLPGAVIYGAGRPPETPPVETR